MNAKLSFFIKKKNDWSMAFFSEQSKAEEVHMIEDLTTIIKK